MPPHVASRYWNPAIETLSREAIRTLQLDRLKRQVAYNFERSPFYAEQFRKVGAAPSDIRSFADFERLPVMTKDDHRLVQEESLERFGSPYALLACAPPEKIVRISATSGTTGMPTLYTLTQRDVDVVNEMHARKYWRAGIRPGHTMLQALSLSMFTGGLPLSQGIMHLGACCVPVGISGGAKRVFEFLHLTAPQALIATPSFGRHLLEKSVELAGKPARDLGIEWFFCAGEPGGGLIEVRKALAEGFGCKVFDHTGGGHAFHGISCDEPADQFSGMQFVSEDHCLLELRDPGTKAPVELCHGASGEMIFTFLDWEGGPLMRYALGDVIQVMLDEGPDGQSGIRFQIIGRADDMLIVKGVNVYPQAIANALLGFRPRITGHFRIALERPGPLVPPPLHLRVERGLDLADGDLHSLEDEIRTRMRAELRISPAIEWLSPEALPRESGKTRLVEAAPVSATSN